MTASRSVPAVTRAALRGANWWILGPVLLYAVLVLGGITQSSLGIDTLREETGQAHSDKVGGALAIRSDEFLTSTPVRIGATVTGESDDLNPLTAPQQLVTLIPEGPVSSVVLFDGALLRHAPLGSAQLLALNWWLPFLVLGLAAPALTRRITGTPWPGLFAAGMAVFTPASVWWSFSPLGPFAFAIGGTTALLVAAEHATTRRYARASAWGLLAAVLLARTPFLYQPWALVLAPTVLIIGVAFLLGRPGWRRHLVVIGATGAASLGMVAAMFLENRAALEAIAGTVYPGDRVSTGGPVSVGQVFGAPTQGRLRFLQVVASNHSEVSASYAEAAIVAALVLLLGLTFRDRAHRWAVIAGTAGTGFWFAWTLVGVGHLHIPLLGLVPANRSGSVLGLLGVLLLALTVPHVQPVRRGGAVTAGAVSGLVTAWGGATLAASTLPTLSIWWIGATALVVGALTVLVLRMPRRPHAYVAALVLAVAATGYVNPIQFGTGDLGSSEAARELLADGERARAAGEVWASDGLGVDALLVATGVPSVSSRQFTGPDLDGWHLLDPTGAYEHVWNRGGSYTTFVFTDAPELTFTNPVADMIQVAGSACALAERLPQLTTIVSGSQQDAPCLTEVRTFRWGGATQWVYTVDGPT